MANALTSQTIKEIVEVCKRPEPDCRTCAKYSRFTASCWTLDRVHHAVPCTNGDRYEPLPPVKLWRTTC